MAKITLYTLEKYLNARNESLFDDIVLPSSTLIDKDDLTDRIILICGEFESLYADADYMQFATRSFFKSHYRTFERWCKALEVDYEPLENYNRTETESYADGIEYTKTTHEGTKLTTEVSETVTKTSVDGKTTDSVYQGEVTTTAYDGLTTDTSHKGLETTVVDPPDKSIVNEYKQPFNTATEVLESLTLIDNSTVTTLTDTVTGDNTTTTTVVGDTDDPDIVTHTGDVNNPSVSKIQGNASDLSTTTHEGDEDNPTTETITGSSTDPHTIETGHLDDENDTEEVERSDKTITAYGNIGVTTSQQMLKDELSVQLFSLYDKISAMYMTELVVPVYD